ncbi:MDR family MFS transporter [Sphaerisporangium sp. TRM90804]|uniref:MDR family MFS transporter n=1 Tax=Sphaerisporangium sp. TRM90804 TaxID=3031113 RepID=UPI00244CE212|nr:MDR family MFS transporter [Sphaerisporangium sp. TRM90804]MDH2428630.1 MDR family MFS transporter [Sphaerisporangium sp. TRM90804]
MTVRGALPPARDEDAVRRAYSHREILKILSGLMLALLTSMISTSVVGTALPTIVGEFGAQDQLSWVAAATLLTMTASTPLWGRLSDLFGRKRMFQLALWLFVGASLVAGLSANMGMLIAARAVQGLGTGGLAALTQVILGDIVQPRERGRYSGYIGAVFGVSTVTGPLLGGVLVDTPWLGWRWCFYVCVPLAVAAFLVVQRVLRLDHQKRDARVDWWGAFTVTGGASALMLLLSLGGHQFAWNSPWSYGLGAVAALLFVLSVMAERRAADPILPPRLFGDRTFVAAAAASLLVGVSIFGVMIYLPQYLQIVKGMSPAVSGLMTLPLVLSLLVASIGAGRVVTRTGRWKAFPAAGMLLVGTGMALLSQLHADSERWVIGAGLAVLGLGLGMSMQILILAAQNAAPPRDMAVTTSGVTFFRSLGGAVGVAALGAVLTNRVRDEMARMLAAAHTAAPPGEIPLGTPEAIHALPPELRHIVVQAFAEAMRTVFLACVPAAVLGFLAVLFLRELPLRSARPAPAADDPA